MNNMMYDGQFSSDRTNDTHFHEIDLITEYNSHDDILRITYKMDNIIMEHGLLLGSFELASNFSSLWLNVHDLIPKFQPRNQFD